MGILGNNITILQILDCSLRLFAVPFSIASFWLTLTNQQKNSDYGDIKFSNFTGLKYLAIISAIAAGYAIVGAVCLWIKIIVSKAWLFFVSDQIVAYLMVTSMASLYEIIELAYEGDKKVTWSEACSSYGIFCGKLKLILVLHIIALCCFLILALISAYRVFSRYDPPFVPSNAAGEGKN